MNYKIIVVGNQQHAVDANHSMLYTIWIIPLCYVKHTHTQYNAAVGNKCLYYVPAMGRE